MAQGFAAHDWLGAIYVAYWGRAADPGGLDYWVNMWGEECQEGWIKDAAWFASNFALQPEAADAYPYFETHQQGQDITRGMREDFIESIYQNLFNRAPEAAGQDYWLEQLETGTVDPGEFIATIVHSALEVGGEDAATITAKKDVAAHMTQQLRGVESDAAVQLAKSAEARDIVDGAHPENVQEQKAAADDILPEPDLDSVLEELVGTYDLDHFTETMHETKETRTENDFGEFEVSLTIFDSGHKVIKGFVDDERFYDKYQFELADASSMLITAEDGYLFERDLEYHGSTLSFYTDWLDEYGREESHEVVQWTRITRETSDPVTMEDLVGVYEASSFYEFDHEAGEVHTDDDFEFKAMLVVYDTGDVVITGRDDDGSFREENHWELTDYSSVIVTEDDGYQYTIHVEHDGSTLTTYNNWYDEHGEHERYDEIQWNKVADDPQDQQVQAMGVSEQCCGMEME